MGPKLGGRSTGWKAKAQSEPLTSAKSSGSKITLKVPPSI
eukprot:CAMPEP_0114693392 /NCGR_PEP_ID=MMETSP0191-20121206/69028_1 /TAXON_ID=126664 /ORGANISM="Sorites sp." /LENGTH=39 /DNA_ID= /DNA_START= /DNA_END= /DNA_ORIENTATION=